MTLLDRLESAMRSAWLPLALLLVALSTVFVFIGDLGYFYRPAGDHSWLSAHHLAVAVNISPEHGFQRFERRLIDDSGITRYRPYNRFPIGGYASMKLATLPFGESPTARLIAARVLMLLFFVAAAILVYLSLCRLVSNRWIALTATLLSFSSYYLLYYNDLTANEGMPDLFAVMLTFHGMIIFVQEGRFRQLLVKTCIALLMGWHVFALLLPFVIIGLASEVIRTRSATTSSPTPLLLQGKRAVGTLLRSRYLLLGIVALGFGLSVLTFNFTMEYVALNGETPLTELPSFDSMLKRSGIGQGVDQTPWPWGAFWEVQFLRIFLMFIPYAWIGSGGILENPQWQTDFRGIVIPAADIDTALVTAELSKFQGVVLGVVLCAACLIGLMFVRHRILFATMASFGFFWTLPMRNSTTFHEFETIYYIGLPLVFFTLILLWARKLTRRDGVIAAVSVLALLLFILSSSQMSRFRYGAEPDRAERLAERALLTTRDWGSSLPYLAARLAERDLLAIRDLTAGQLVTVLPIGNTGENFLDWGERRAMNYYLNSSLIRYTYLPAVEGGFVVMREHIDTDALLTPQNNYFFLYDRDGLEESYGAMYRSVTSGEPLASGEFDVYLDGRTLYYLKEPCERRHVAGRLFLHVYPIDENDLPEARKRYGFEILDFEFGERGLLFDGKCLASVDLPRYDLVKINTGRIGGNDWRATHVVQGPELSSMYQSVVSTEPVARSEFDLYIDGDRLHYVKESCSDEDTAARFFLHVAPADLEYLPDDRKQSGFENLDFDFSQRGLLFDGKCLVSFQLPQYRIARITTGQFEGANRIWEVEVTPVAHE